MKASAVRLSVPMAGPRAMALNASERLGVVKIASSASWLSKASGTEICSKSLLRFGVCMVTLPTPLFRHAFAERMAAPAMP